MDTTNASGTHDTDMHDMAADNEQQKQAGMSGTPIGEEDEMPEAFEVTQEELIIYSDDEDGSGRGFRWWYVPAVVLPVAAGATLTTLWLLQRREKQPIPMELPSTFVQRARKWLADADLRQMTAQAQGQASGLLQQGMQWTRLNRRTLQQQLPESTSVRERLNQLAAQISTLREQVPAQVTAQVATLREQVPVLVGTLSEQVPVLVGTWSEQARTATQPVLVAAKARTLTVRDTASQALDATSARVNKTMNRSLAFGLGVVLAATATYVGLWRQRMAQMAQEPQQQ